MSGTELVNRRWNHRVERLRASVVDGPDKGRPPVEAGDRLAVGVAPDNDLVLADPTVSRYHLELSRADGGIVVRDLGSSNGTFVRDVRVGYAIVAPGSVVRIGRSSVKVDEAGEMQVEAALEAIPDMVAESDAMRDVVHHILQLAPTEVSVLIEGETGTGKEVVARAVHERSARRAGPFVVLDCGSLPATLIASELFGHERGAFTGADQARAGAFETASGGTLFLDEIGELPLHVQPMLLGVLERRRFRRLGATVDTAVDVRVVSATHRDLRSEVNSGGFRPDLYFRLAPARITIPPLRDRPADIEPLVRHFVQAVTGELDMAGFSPDAIAALRNHRWSGNVRELRNVVESAIALGRVALADEAGAAEAATGGIAPYKDARREVLDQFEAGYLRALMALVDGNVSEAARRARMDRAYLLNLLRRNGLR